MNDEVKPQAESPQQPAVEENDLPATEPAEKEIDLNVLFPEEGSDLNALFEDDEIKRLLKNISKNKKDLHTIKDRISEENFTEDDSEDSAETDPESESENS